MSKRMVYVAAGGFLFLMYAVTPPPRTLAAGGEVDVIVNKANTITEIPMAEAKKVFMEDKTTWPSGKRITVLMLASSQPARAVVLQEIYKMSDSDYGKYFQQAAFEGKVTAPPKEFGSAAQMKQAVGDNAGAVGYVNKEDVDDSVKVVLKLD